MNCLNCQNSIIKGKFCSRNCSATYNNKGKIRHGTIHHCKFCNERMINKRTVFCSKACRNSFNGIHDLAMLEEGLMSSSRKAKSYLIKTYGNKCMSSTCAWDYTKQHIAPELEHIDGNSDNNKLDNLTLLCPNCHSLTPTYKSKNNGNGRFKRKLRYQNGLSH